jgi:phenylalanyl-tRNA synthetase beta chain
MREILKRLACTPEGGAEAFRVTAPSWRFDLALEEDFIEEIARIHGYEHVPSAPPRSSVPMLRLEEARRTRFDLRHAMAALGYHEVVSYSFVPEAWERDFCGNERPVRLANPIAATMAVMRTSLLGGLVQALSYNLNRSEARVRLFEIGRCFQGADADVKVQPERIAGLAYGARHPEQWAEKAAPVDFFDVKGDLEGLAGGVPVEFAPGEHPSCHPGRCARVRIGGVEAGFVGELHPRLQQQHELDSAPVVFEVLVAPLLEGRVPAFAGVSRMPAVRRDLALIVVEKVPARALLEAARKGLPGFVRAVEIFDEYRGKGVEPGQKSLALRIVMQDTDRTLTDSEVEGVVTSIREQLNQEFQAKPRT